MLTTLPRPLGKSRDEPFECPRPSGGAQEIPPHEEQIQNSTQITQHTRGHSASCLAARWRTKRRRRGRTPEQ
eukprot:1983810-Pyramimonas_sp.AAC.1